VAVDIHLNDFGTQFLVTVKDQDDAPIDASGATIRFYFLKPDKTTLTKTGSLYTDGTDGQVYYTAESGVLDDVGGWQLQVRVHKTGQQFSSDVESFKVCPNLT
jgi:hypothetical protein